MHHSMLLALAGLLVIGHVTHARQLVKTPKSSVAALSDSNFDYFMLVRQWSGTFCSQHECPMVHRHGFRFTIHGLWPNYAAGGWPQDCNANMRFDESKLSEILPELQEEWPSVFKEDESFWAHEWSKHGTCALDIFPTEYDFFKGTLDLHATYDLQSVFSDAGITPSLTKTYRAYDLVQAVKKAYGVTPQLHCTNNRLSEIWMCVGKDLSVINCPSASSPLELARESCSDVIIPPLPSAPSSQTSISSNLMLGMAATRTAAQQQQQQQQQEPIPLTGATSTVAASSQQTALPQQGVMSLTSASSSSSAVDGEVSVTGEYVSEQAAAAMTELGLPIQGEGGGLVVLSEGVVRTGIDQLVMMARLAALLTGQVEDVAVSVIEQQLSSVSADEDVLVISLDDPTGLDGDISMLVVDEQAWGDEDEEPEDEEAEDDDEEEETHHHEHHHRDSDEDDDRQDVDVDEHNDEDEDKKHHHRRHDADSDEDSQDANSDQHSHRHHSDESSDADEDKQARKDEKAEKKAEKKRSEKAEKADKAARKAEGKQKKRDRDDDEDDSQRDVDSVDQDDESAAGDEGDAWSTAYMSQTKSTSVVKDVDVQPTVALRLEVARSSDSSAAARFSSIVRVSPADAATSSIAVEPATERKTSGPCGYLAAAFAIAAIMFVFGSVLLCGSLFGRRAADADEDKIWCAKGVIYDVLPVVERPTYSVSRPLLRHADAQAPICT